MKRFSNFMGRDYSIEFDASNQTFFAQTAQEPDIQVAQPSPHSQPGAPAIELKTKKLKAAIKVGKAREISTGNVQITRRNDKKGRQKAEPAAI
jgi:hypothetical protein